MMGKRILIPPHRGMRYHGRSMSAPPTTTQPNPLLERAIGLLNQPLLELILEAATVHRANHDPARIQCAHLFSIKTGACPEDCGYCSQSAHHSSGLAREALTDLDSVRDEAKKARESGADRLCLGAAWRGVKDGPDFDRVLEMVRAVKHEGLEACATLGMLDLSQAERLRDAGLDYYNHNLDTGRSHYQNIVTTRTYDERLDTLQVARDAGLSLCCGGILGMGETREQRAEFLAQLAALDPAPESVPINSLVPVEGTPLENQDPLPWDEVVRMVATARIMMPKSTVRLSAGRESMTEEAQSMCFLAGANSVFLGEKLLTTKGRGRSNDADLFQRLGMNPVQEG
jgi:biotin synthase